MVENFVTLYQIVQPNDSFLHRQDITLKTVALIQSNNLRKVCTRLCAFTFLEAMLGTKRLWKLFCSILQELHKSKSFVLVNFTFVCIFQIFERVPRRICRTAYGMGIASLFIPKMIQPVKWAPQFSRV